MIELIHGDCFEHLKNLAKNRVNCAVIKEYFTTEKSQHIENIKKQRHENLPLF